MSQLIFYYALAYFSENIEKCKNVLYYFALSSFGLSLLEIADQSVALLVLYKNFHPSEMDETSKLNLVIYIGKTE